MGSFLPIVQWGLNLLVLALVGIGKWGMSQREKANAAVLKSITDRIDANEAHAKEHINSMAKLQSDLAEQRRRTDQVEGYMQRAAEDFATALRQIEKVTDRLNTISENMLRKSDLELIARINQG